MSGEQDIDNKTKTTPEAAGYRADLTNSVIIDDITDRRIFHRHEGHRYVNFSAIDKMTAATWDNEMTQFYIQRAYTRGSQNCHHPMISSIYNQIIAGLWVIKVNIECGTATADETEFWSTVSRMIQFESLAIHPQMFALLSTIQPHIPKDDRFGRITPKMWTDIRNHHFTPDNHHLADGMYKYLIPDYFGMMSGALRLAEGVSFVKGQTPFTFFRNLDSTAPRPAVEGDAALGEVQLNQAVGSARMREFGLIPGYGTYRTDDGSPHNVGNRCSLIDYVKSLQLPRPNADENVESLTGMFFMDKNVRWLNNLSDHMSYALSFYKDIFKFSDLKVTDDSNITIEMVNTNISDLKRDFDAEQIRMAAIPQAVQNAQAWQNNPPANNADLNAFAQQHQAHAAIRPDYIWANRLRTQHNQEITEHSAYAREKDVPQMHKKNTFIYGIYAPVRTMDYNIGWHNTTDGEFFNNEHNPRRYSYNPEDPSRVLKQVLNAKLFSRSQDAKTSAYHK